MNFSFPVLAYLAILLVIFALVFFALNSKKKEEDLKKFAGVKLVSSLVSNVSKFKVFFKALLLALATGSIVLALARPMWGYKWEEQTQMGVDIIFAVDTSKSMLAEDLKPNRLERAKLAISEIIDRLSGDRIGLVAFAGQAFLQCPITLDYDAFKMSLDSLDTNIIQRGGTNIASAISEAESALQSKSTEKIIVLISDGEELESSAIKKAEEVAKHKGIKIYTLGIGSANGEAIPVRDSKGNLKFLRDENGKLVSSKLNEEVLTEVAKKTGGFYANLSNNGMEQIFEEGIEMSQKSEVSSKMKKSMIERFQIPLAIALILLSIELLIGTRRMFAKRGFQSSSFVICLLIPALFFSKNLSAQENSATWLEAFNEGVGEFESGNFDKAKDKFYHSIASTLDLNRHADSYYNIACVDYEVAKAGLKNLPELSGELGKANELQNQASSSIATGLDVLKAGQEALKKSEEALKEQNLQNQIKQTISACEKSKKEIDASEKSIGETSQNLSKIFASASSALANFKNAKELNPNLQRLEKNISAAQNAQNKLDAFIKEFSQKSLLNKEAQSKLTKLIEELKKLLRDENKDKQDKQDNKENKENKNDSQNQDKNENQDNKDKQNQDSNNKDSDKNQDDSQKNQDSQNSQNSQDSKGSQNKNDEDKSKQNQDKQSSENSSQENQNSSDKNGESQNQDNPQNQKSDEKNDAKNDSKNDGSTGDDSKNADLKDEPNKEQNNSQKDSQDSSDDKNSEEAISQNQESPVAQNQEDSKKDEGAVQSQKDESAQKSEQAAAGNLEKSKEENTQKSIDYRAANGVMTRREAAQILDAQKDSDKKLPYSGYGNQKRRYENINYKDW